MKRFRIRFVTLIALQILLSVCISGQSQATRYRVIITEIMADPSPARGLPESEFIEIYNTGTETISLKGWSIKDRSATGTISSEVSIEPGQYVILCASGSASALAAFGKTVIVTRFPSLDNAGDLLVLEDADGNTVHALEYSMSWYGNKIKEEGGWTLEMIDVSRPCLQNIFENAPLNWAASSDPSGGTPGRSNNPERKARPTPELKTIHSFIPDANQVKISFNLPLDDNLASEAFSLSPGNHRPLSIQLLPPFFQEVELQFGESIDTTKIYDLKINNAASCGGLASAQNLTLKTAYPYIAEPGSLKINEILFNPKPPAEDFVEIINRSDRAVNLSSLKLANRNSRGELNSIVPVTSFNRLILPDECVAITTNPDALKLTYLTKAPDQLLSVNSLPSMPNDKGFVLLLNDQGEIIDEVAYSENWHHPLLRNAAGISLERIFAGGSSSDPSNWQSASASVGYATPGYKNSQAGTETINQNTYSLPYTLFTPDQNGDRDLLFVNYELEEDGWLASVRIFTPQGWPVRWVARQFLMGKKGFFRWDGTNDKGEPMASGHYLVVIERFHTSGKTHLWKKAISLIR